jgi:hypothetical protein
MIDLLFFSLTSFIQEYFTCIETSPLPVMGCKIKAYDRRLGPQAGRDLYRATPFQ